MTYSLTGGDDYTTFIPTATDAGTYTVYYKVPGDDIYNEVAGSVEVTISYRAAELADNADNADVLRTSSPTTADGLT
ncbi:MAG: hypothetical protein IKO12_08370 [Bacteroidaceae bacterium]|nr:hypothetical protein [Bacteroidaceae bacterium]